MIKNRNYRDDPVLGVYEIDRRIQDAIQIAWSMQQEGESSVTLKNVEGQILALTERALRNLREDINLIEEGGDLLV